VRPAVRDGGRPAAFSPVRRHHAQLRINITSSAVPMSETRIEPAQPSLLEKKTNTRSG
jgi:hypothetical protein